jgi:hypothetical protein
MDRHDRLPEMTPEMTLAERVLAARRKLGLARLARRADVPVRMVTGVCVGMLAFDAAPLHRLLATAEAVAGNEPRP